MKTCGKCRGEKDESEFPRDSHQSDGLYRLCKRCHAVYQKEQRVKYRARIHTEEVTVPHWCPRCQTMKTRQDFCLVRSNPTGLASACKACENKRVAKSLQAHPATKRRQDQRYRQTPNYLVSNRAKDQRRRAAKHGATLNDFTKEQWEAMKRHYGYRCVYCGVKTIALTQDHLTPLSKGGNHTASNILPACRSCNSRKQAGEVLRPVQPLLLAVS